MPAAALGRRPRRIHSRSSARFASASRSPRAWPRSAMARARLRPIVVRHVRVVIARSEPALVEGAGGLLVPLTDARRPSPISPAPASCALLVVVGNRLGAINHARLTLDWARAARPERRGLCGQHAATGDRSRRADQRRGARASCCGPSLGVLPFLGPSRTHRAERARLARSERSAADAALRRACVAT